jgi:N-acetylmuramoyl-L-alanine amidase
MNILQGVFWLFLTVYHEARGEPDVGQRNVVKVILNRAHRKNWPIENIVLARKQFSCFNNGIEGNPEIWIKNIPSMAKVSANVLAAITEWEAGDILQGATHYYAIKGMVTKRPPYWAKNMDFIVEVAGHRFLRER